jgi:16S rRNA C1402 N4-methylase RsmH
MRQPLRSWASSVDPERARHRPVLMREVVELLRPCLDGVIVDCTVGTGGHAEALLSASERVRVIGIDWDEEALALARERLRAYGSGSCPYMRTSSVWMRSSPSSGLRRSKGFSLTLASRRFNWRRPSEGSAFSRKGRSTCAWIGGGR